MQNITLNLMLIIIWSLFLYGDIKQISRNKNDLRAWAFVGAAVVFIFSGVYNIGMEIFH